MKLNIEDFRRRINKFINTKEYIEIYRRGKLVIVLMPPKLYEPTGSTSDDKTCFTDDKIKEVQPTGSEDKPTGSKEEV